jgi:hypothetical protein
MRAPKLVPVLVLAAASAACGRGVPGGEDADPGAPDASSTIDGTPGPDAMISDFTTVYAHDDDILYRVDTATLDLIEVGPFGAALGTAGITDIAIDKDDRMVGVSLGKIWEIDETTGTASHLADFDLGNVDGNNLTSLSFVPVSDEADSEERLIAATSLGNVYEINVDTGEPTLLGNYGMSGGFQIASSGDIVSVRGFGTLATVNASDEFSDPDYLAWIDTTTWEATLIGTSTTGFDKIFGIGFWRGTVYGFVDHGSDAGTGSFITIDTTTGVGTVIETGNVRWWGAGVTTDAPIVD